MCQSPKIADVLIRAQNIPANDNLGSSEAGIKLESANLLKAACQTVLVCCSAVVFLFF